MSALLSSRVAVETCEMDDLGGLVCLLPRSPLPPCQQVSAVSLQRPLAALLQCPASRGLEDAIQAAPCGMPTVLSPSLRIYGTVHPPVTLQEVRYVREGTRPPAQLLLHHIKPLPSAHEIVGGYRTKQR